MKRWIGFPAVAVLSASLTSSPLHAQDKEWIDRSFNAIETVSLKTLIGECRVEKSEDEDIHVTVLHQCYEADYEAGFETDGGKLILDEKIAWDSDDLVGRSIWSLRVPEGTKISFSSIMGSFLAKDLALDIKLETITGEVGMVRCSGDFNVLSGTGEINILDCRGSFVLSSGIGNISIAASEGSFEVASEEGLIVIDGIALDVNKSVSSLSGSTGRKFSPFGNDGVATPARILSENRAMCPITNINPVLDRQEQESAIVNLQVNGKGSIWWTEK